MTQNDKEIIRVDYQHDDEIHSIETKFLLHALGRIPTTDGLNLEAIGVEIEKSGHIKTNAFQQTSVPHIYAAGDCAGPHEIVHVAIRQAETATSHSQGQSPESISYDHLLGVVFTDPQVATVIYYQESLKKEGSLSLRIIL